MGVDVIGFTIFAFAMISTPGPANMVLLSVGAAHGMRAAWPFIGGVVLGKQFIIWPIGFGLMAVIAGIPWLFAVLKWGSAAYMIWLAWRIANSRINPDGPASEPPGFRAGLIIHPLNPKAWAMITVGYTNFVAPGTTPLLAATGVAAVLLVVQCVLHPLWSLGGDRLAKLVKDKPSEVIVMRVLALLTVASIFYVIGKDMV